MQYSKHISEVNSFVLLQIHTSPSCVNIPTPVILLVIGLQLLSIDHWHKSGVALWVEVIPLFVTGVTNRRNKMNLTRIDVK